jgi:hypothetical protein
MRILTLLLLLLLAAASHAQTITQAEYFLDTDPGVGSGIPIALNHASQFGADSVWSSFSVPAAGTMGYGPHRVYTRFRDGDGHWTSAQLRHYFIFTPWSSNYQTRVVTHAEISFDTLAPVVQDIADGGTVNLIQAVASTGLGRGLHRFYVRYRDNIGQWSGQEGRFLFIAALPPSPLVSNHLVGGEYFVNEDPGLGNGVPFGAPDIGGWDTGAESVHFRLTGLPVGTHFLGLRFRDAFNNWSEVLSDTLIVGPTLTVHISGSDIILDWVPTVPATSFHVFRADLVGGPYAVVDSTTSTTWADANVLNLSSHHYYYIRQTTPGALSSFRLPHDGLAPARP